MKTNVCMQFFLFSFGATSYFCSMNALVHVDIHDSQKRCLFEIKIPKTNGQFSSSSSVFHAGHKYGLHFEIEATFLALFKFSHFLQDFTYRFFVYYQIVANFINNHATVVRRFCFHPVRRIVSLTGRCGGNWTTNLTSSSLRGPGIL